MDRNSQNVDKPTSELVFRQNQLYVESLATGRWLASIILISDWVQMLSITMGDWNKQMPTWINFAASCINLKILHGNPIGVLALLGLTIMLNIIVMAIICIRQPSE